jgi:hypothetical protein
MIDLIDTLFETLYRMNPIARWFATFFLIFCLTFALYLIIATPFLMLGIGSITLGFVFWGAVGCSIGTGLVNATLFLLT